MDFEYNFVDRVARRGELLGQLVALKVSREKVNILAIHVLLEFFYSLQIIGLDSEVQGMHQVWSAQEVEIEEFEVSVDYFFEAHRIVLADVLYISKKLTHSVGFVLVKRIYQRPVLL